MEVCILLWRLPCFRISASIENLRLAEQILDSQYLVFIIQGIIRKMQKRKR